MGIERLFTRDVTIVRPATVEGRYHDSQPDWTATTETATKGWLGRMPLSTGEVINNRDAIITGDILYVAADVDIGPTDRIVVDATTYEVDGPPNLAHTPRGPHHLEVLLKAVEG